MPARLLHTAPDSGKRQQRQREDIQKTIYGKHHIKAQSGTTEGAHTQSCITDSDVYPVDAYRKLPYAKQTSQISHISTTNNYSRIGLRTKPLSQHILNHVTKIARALQKRTDRTRLFQFLEACL